MALEPSALSQIASLFSPIHKDGYKFVLAAAGVTVLFFLLSSGLGLLAMMVTLALAFFFRDPVRIVPMRDGLLVSPADGIVISIDTVAPPEDLALGATPLTRISIFLSLLDVHVVRSPVGGTVSMSAYHPGSHINAAGPAASRENERHGYVVTTPGGQAIGTVLIAGLTARRVVAEANLGDVLAAGARVGIIRFGSRVDVYCPSAPFLAVAEGQRVIAGETVIADYDMHDAPRAFRRI